MDTYKDTKEIIPCIVDIIPTTDVNNIKYIDLCGLFCIFEGQIFHSVPSCEVFAHLRLSN
jgi:hypothetical protein